MSVVRLVIDARPETVFTALTDPYTYPHWLVGCKEIRSVDAAWPTSGSRFHHRVGIAGPVTVKDSTKVLEIESPHLLSLEVRGRPLGRGRSTFTLRPVAGEGSTARTIVELEEVPIGLLAPTRPLADPLTAHRNRRSLANLARYLQAASPSRGAGTA